MSKINEDLFGPRNRAAAFVESTNQTANAYTQMTALFNHTNVIRKVRKEPIFVDVGCGEGDLTIPVMKALLSKDKSYKLIGIDPSQGMLDGLRKRMKQEGLEGLLLTDKFFDNDEVDMAYRIKNLGRGDIVLCSHAIYHAEDANQASDKLLQITNPDGILIGVHEAKTSQVHLLRNEFSTASVRYPIDNQSIAADHMEARIAQTLKMRDIPKVSVTSDLRFKPETADFADNFACALQSDKFVEEDFSVLVDAYGQNAVVDRNVMEYILGENIFSVPRTQGSAFLHRAASMIRQNTPAEDGSPRIVITDSVSFISHSPEVRVGLWDFARQNEPCLAQP